MIQPAIRLCGFQAYHFKVEKEHFEDEQHFVSHTVRLRGGSARLLPRRQPVRGC